MRFFGQNLKDSENPKSIEKFHLKVKCRGTNYSKEIVIYNLFVN